MNSAANNVCHSVVEHDLCIGCGVCAGVCPTNTLQMRWSPEGLLIPEDLGRCSPKCDRCLQVCPFMNGVPDENEIGRALFKGLPGMEHREETGYYLSAYAGYASPAVRMNGASGGLATWFLQSLLRQAIVDRVVCVRATENPDQRFAFDVFSTPDEVAKCGKSAYYPVDVAEVLRKILTNEGRYAVIGLPCVIKALRLAQTKVPLLKRRIVLLAGLVCGQTKSKYFSEYLVRNMGFDPARVANLDFRAKHPNRPASNFEIRARTPSGQEGLHVWNAGLYGRTWHSGEFTPHACTVCDDVFAETADIVFMDAWLPEYTPDSKGTSLALVRSQTARSVIEKGIAEGELTLHPLHAERVVASQAGVVKHKREKLANRLWSLHNEKRTEVRKRVTPARPGLWERLVLTAREDLRRASHYAAGIARRGSQNWLEDYNRTVQSHRRRLNALLFPARLVRSFRLFLSRSVRVLGLR